MTGGMVDLWFGGFVSGVGFGVFIVVLWVLVFAIFCVVVCFRFLGLGLL